MTEQTLLGVHILVYMCMLELLSQMYFNPFSFLQLLWRESQLLGGDCVRNEAS